MIQCSTSFCLIKWKEGTRRTERLCFFLTCKISLSMYQGALSIDIIIFELLIAGIRDKNSSSKISSYLLLRLFKEWRWGGFDFCFEREPSGSNSEC